MVPTTAQICDRALWWPADFQAAWSPTRSINSVTIGNNTQMAAPPHFGREMNMARYGGQSWRRTNTATTRGVHMVWHLLLSQGHRVGGALPHTWRVCNPKPTTADATGGTPRIHGLVRVTVATVHRPSRALAHVTVHAELCSIYTLHPSAGGILQQ